MEVEEYLPGGFAKCGSPGASSRSRKEPRGSEGSGLTLPPVLLTCSPVPVPSPGNSSSHRLSCPWTN